MSKKTAIKRYNEGNLNLTLFHNPSLGQFRVSVNILELELILKGVSEAFAVSSGEARVVKGVLLSVGLCTN